MAKQKNSTNSSLAAIKRTHARWFKKQHVKFPQKATCNNRRVSKLQKGLNEYSILPSEQMQKKLDYFFSSYNNKLLRQKYMDFDSKKNWHELTEFILDQNKDIFRNSLKSINNELYQGLGRIKSTAGVKEAKLTGLENGRNNSYESLVSDDLNNSDDRSSSLMQVTENTRKLHPRTTQYVDQDQKIKSPENSLFRTSCISSENLLESCGKQMDNSSCDRRLTNIDDLLLALRNQKERDPSQQLPEENTFTDFLTRNFNYRKQKRRTMTKVNQRRSILSGVKQKLIPHFEPIRINSSMESRPPVQIRNPGDCDNKKNWRNLRKFHTSQGLELSPKKLFLKTQNLRKQKHDKKVSSPTWGSEISPKLSMEPRKLKDFKLLKKSALFTNSVPSKEESTVVQSAGSPTKKKSDISNFALQNLKLKYSKNPNQRKVSRRNHKLRTSIKTYLNSSFDMQVEQGSPLIELQATTTKKKCSREIVKKSIACDEIDDFSDFLKL